MRQIWVVLGVMIFGLVLSYVMADGDRLIAKGLSIGALIAFIGQLILLASLTTLWVLSTLVKSC